jgi:hypothetical protein
LKTKLEIEEDISFQKKEWTFQKIGLYSLITILFLAIAGLFGNGLFTTSDASANNFIVEYEKIIRKEEIFTTTLILNDVSKVNDSVTVKINNEYCENLRIEFIIPQPLNYAADGNGYSLTFGLNNPVPPLKIYFHMIQDKPDIKNCRIQVEGSGEINFIQIILP